MNTDTEFIYRIKSKLLKMGNDKAPVFDVIMDKLIEKASQGDVGAIKLVLEWSAKIDARDQEIRF